MVTTVALPEFLRTPKAPSRVSLLTNFAEETCYLPKGQANIKGNNWIKKAAKACKRVCGPATSVLIVIGGLAAGDAPHEIGEDAACEAVWGCKELH